MLTLVNGWAVGLKCYEMLHSPLLLKSIFCSLLLLLFLALTVAQNPDLSPCWPLYCHHALRKSSHTETHTHTHTHTHSASLLHIWSITAEWNNITEMVRWIPTACLVPHQCFSDRWDLVMGSIRWHQTPPAVACSEISWDHNSMCATKSSRGEGRHGFDWPHTMVTLEW